MKRVLTALVLVPVLIAIIGYAPPLCFLLLVCGASVLALEEYFSLATQAGLEVFRVPGHGSSLLLLSSLYGSATNVTSSWTALLSWSPHCCCSSPWVCAAVTASNCLAGRCSNPARLALCFSDPGVAGRYPSIANVLGSGKTVGFLSSNRGLVRGHGCLLYRVAPWARILWHHSSVPKKTIEGALGGLFGNILAAVLGKQILLPDAPLPQLLVLALLLGRCEPDWRPLRIGTETRRRG